MGRPRWALLIATFVAACGGTADPVADGPSAGPGAEAAPVGPGTILFPVGSEGPPRYTAVAADGSGERDVLARVWVEDLDWSPDGRSLAVIVSETGDDDGALVVLDATTLEEVQELAQGRNPTSVAWSADGEELAFSTAPEDAPTKEAPAPVGELFVVAAGGGEPRHLGPGHRPSWSPDGTQLAVEVDPDIVIVPRDGGPRRVLATGATRPAWSPDGRSIAYVAGGRGLEVAPAAGGAAVSYGPAGGEEVTWSSTGWLASAGQGASAVVIAPDGQARELADPGDGTPWPAICVAWSPDGRSLAVANLVAVHIYDVTTSSVRRVAEPGWPEGPQCPLQWRAAPLGEGPGIG